MVKRHRKRFRLTAPFLWPKSKFRNGGVGMAKRIVEETLANGEKDIVYKAILYLEYLAGGVQ